MTLMNGELARKCIQIHLLQTRVYQKIGLQSQTGINTSATVYGSHYSNGEVHYYFNANQKIE